jgi:hypothetical protein
LKTVDASFGHEMLALRHHWDIWTVMPYVDQFDGLVPAQDAGGRMRNVRTIVVFTDGIVICAVGVHGVWLVNRALLPGFGHLGSLLLAMIRPGQRMVRSRRQRAVRKHAMRLGPEGTAAAFARTRPRSLGIVFADVQRIALTSTREGRLLVVQTASAEDSKERVYSYLNDLSAERVREVLGPLIGARLAVPAP